MKTSSILKWVGLVILVVVAVGEGFYALQVMPKPATAPSGK